MNVLGLDISTACVGVAVVNAHARVCLEHVVFKGKMSLWEKADHVKLEFEKFHNEYGNIDRLFVEDAALRFTPGMSSAMTIASLLRFNGLVSYIARNVFDKDPNFISASSARKMIGLKLQQVKKCGISHKIQVFEALAHSDLSDVCWPLKKSGAVIDWAYDVTDAYVIAKAGMITVTSQEL